ncbi:MAG: hydantoinase/oxoprolinase family protein [Candidatus Carbobacillus altaicus]|uniref:Acetone carboxylase, beta subunit n=1 Tax=Candidatus Carbonibacillus altaicus TaxID=2163959 RepID=A0A2R6Y4R1_9BACL|nr:hydantoinase/oxoprolinase family protein [Candidatus Carbobacillus altaicus]PTQ57677.1 MAG: Acetone carboxylase, beta subunit [Candidatus Carbobacillus altaicus]
MTGKIQVLGIDAGGTMTDTFFVDTEGNFVVGKAQSTPQDESEGLIQSSADALMQWGLTVEEVFPQLITGVYSGTSMLNRVVQRKGLEVGLIVNRGMEDFHRMGRAIQSYLGYSYEDRIHLNTHRYDPPLVPRERTVGVTERIDMFGNIVIPLREEEAYAAIERLLAMHVEGIVISFLHAYKNPQHERRVRDLAQELITKKGLNIPVFASSDYYPVRKESHRTNTTILEAYAAEPSRKTLVRMNDRLKALGARFDLRVMASHGGTISWKAKELARTIVSGPIGGVIGTKNLGEELGYKNIAATDIGGTSFDMALIVQGQFTIQHDPDMARLVLSLPLVQMDSVGSGAGSYVRIDPYTRSIKIGPDSAGYRVGVCWEESGVDTVTVSDCHVVLGYINPDNFLGGQVKLNKERARQAIKEQLADPLGLTVEEAAAGVIELLDTRLRDHLRSMISGKGYHPSEFVCFSYGGAGPVHTYGYTEGLDFEDVVVPAWAAGFSAYGCAAAEFEYRYDKSLDINLDFAATTEAKMAAVSTLQEAWNELAEKVIAEFELNGYKAQDVVLVPGYRMMYRGQLNDIEIDSPIARATQSEDWDRLTEAFENTYERVYARSARSPELGYTVTGVIMRGFVTTVKPKIPNEPLQQENPPESAKRGQRALYYRAKWVDATIWDMDSLYPGNVIIGPSIVEAPATTLVLPPGWSAFLDKHRLFHLRHEKDLI